jgi:ParB-like chromosome segregation protein Spo0J
MNIRKHPAIKSRKDYFMVDPREIKIIDGWNPRVDFTGQEDFERDIIQNGVKDPILLKITKSEDLVLIDGERRLSAVLYAIDQGVNIEAIPARIAPQGISDSNALIEAVIRNHSKPFMPLEEAEAYRRLVVWGHSIDVIAKDMGKTIQHIKKRLSLLDGCKEVQEALGKKKIPTYLAENIISESDGNIKKQKELVKEATKSKEGKNKVKKLVDQTLSVSELGNEKYWEEEDLIYSKIDDAISKLSDVVCKGSNLPDAVKLLENVLKALDKRAKKFRK